MSSPLKELEIIRIDRKQDYADNNTSSAQKMDKPALASPSISVLEKFKKQLLNEQDESNYGE